jgi:muconolactone delta-isomerase
MKILALEKDISGVSDSAFTPDLLKLEAARAWELQQSGVIRELYFRSDRLAAVLVMECAHTEEAREVLATLPLVQQGLIDFDIVPLIPYPGFQRLFS